MPATLAQRYEEVRQEVTAAALRAGRDPSGITLVVVTKAAPPSVFEAASAAGIQDVGENRLPAALERMAGYESAFRWHFVGHLQANKARRAVAAFDVFHGIDSLALLARVDRLAAEMDRRPELLLQVNVSGEASKHGFTPQEVPAAVRAATGLQAARVVGLMTMAPQVSDPEEARPVFADLAALRRDMTGVLPLPHLSMGMSEDFVVAVEEGATLIRIGRRIVDGLD